MARLLFASCALLGSVLLCAANPTVVSKTAVPDKIKDNYFDIIVDIRSSEEHEKGHIKGSINLPMPTAIEKLKGCEGKKIAVHCFRGNDRARPFSHQLAKGGYKFVYDIGGFRDIQEHVTTATGVWDGKLPSCAGSSSAYINSQVRLQGVEASQFDAMTKRKFTAVIAPKVGKICGDGKQECDSSSVTITSISGGKRRSSATEVSFTVKTTPSSAADGMQTLGAYIASTAFKTDLKGAGGNFATISATAVVAAPSQSSTNPVPHSAPTAPTKTTPAPVLKDGVLVVAPTSVASQLDNFDIIVDVRSPHEYSKGHIPGALNLPGYSAVKKLKGCENQKIGVYCWTGPDRATPLARALANAGFSSVYDLGGLQFMTGMVTETGSWDGAYPTCAAGEQGWGLMCTLLIGVAVVFIVLLVVCCACGFHFHMSHNSARVQMVEGAAVAQGVPMNDVDIEKAKAQAAATSMMPPIPGMVAKDPDMAPVAAVPMAEHATQPASMPVSTSTEEAPCANVRSKDEQV